MARSDVTLYNAAETWEEKADVMRWLRWTTGINDIPYEPPPGMPHEITIAVGNAVNSSPKRLHCKHVRHWFKLDYIKGNDGYHVSVTGAADRFEYKINNGTARSWGQLTDREYSWYWGDLKRRFQRWHLASLRTGPMCYWENTRYHWQEKKYAYAASTACYPFPLERARIKSGEAPKVNFAAFKSELELYDFLYKRYDEMMGTMFEDIGALAEKNNTLAAVGPLLAQQWIPMPSTSVYVTVQLLKERIKNRQTKAEKLEDAYREYDA